MRDRAAVAAGFIVSAISLQVLVLFFLLNALVGPPPAAVAVASAAGVAVGYTFVGFGSLDPRRVLGNIRRPRLEIWGALAVVAVAVSVAGPLVAHTVGEGVAVTFATPVLQLVGVVLFVQWARRGSGKLHVRSRPWLGPQAFIAAFLAASAVTSVGALDDVYPFAQFKMYSSVARDPHTLQRVTFTGTDISGESRELPSPVGRVVAVGLAREDPDGLTSLALDLGRRYDAMRVDVHLETISVRPYPGDPGIDIDGRLLVTEVQVVE